MIVDGIIVVLVGFAIILSIHCWLTLYITLYARGEPDYLDAISAPRLYSPPKNGFTILLPCRYEEIVISETLRNLSTANYPKDLIEIIVLCTPDDIETIQTANNAIKKFKINNARVMVFDLPAGKARGLNIGLQNAKHDLITIFDSEDDVSKDLFNIINTLFINQDIDIVQGGISLMDYSSHWYSANNVLEYFFWFKYRMYYFNKIGAVPLGGNTVFFRRTDLNEVGGWNEKCLTEDADIGIRLSLLGKKVHIMYDPLHVTKEETPPTIMSFIKQRTRWTQGFMQIVLSGNIGRLKKLKQRFIILYLFTSSLFIGAIFVITPTLTALCIIFGVSKKMWLPLMVPLLLILICITLNVVGLREYSKDQNAKIKLQSYLLMIVTFIPYQFVIGFAAARALSRELIGVCNWEKTAHLGAHRDKKYN